jgi:hypothetical protein
MTYPRPSMFHLSRRSAGSVILVPAAACLALLLSQAAPLAAQVEDRPNATEAELSDEERARQQILQSDRWQDMQFEFGQWLTDQSLYDDEQVQETVTRMRRGVSRMNPAQLTRFLSDMEGRLDVLTSPAAREAQVYFAKKFQVASAAYAKRIRQDLPDLVTASPAQLEQKLMVHAQRRNAAQQSQTSFNEARQAGVQMNQAQRQAATNARQQRARRPAASTGGGASEFPAARDYFPERQRPSFMFGGYGMF